MPESIRLTDPMCADLGGRVGGKTSMPFSTVRSEESLWGIDLGGTKIEGVILNPIDVKKPLFRLRTPTESSGGYEHVLEQVSRLIVRLEETSGMTRPDTIGIGTPGVTNRETGCLKNSNTLCLNGEAFRDDLSRLLGCQVILANDANCCTLAESLCGAAIGYRTVFGVILGTGVGGGIVVDSRVLEGPHGICGEWGHNPLRGEDARCYCGRSGCLEMVCSGPALERYYVARGGESLKLPQIVALAKTGEMLALETMERLREKFAEAIGAVVNILDPDAIVIGGGVGNLDLLYESKTRDAITQHLFNDRFETPLLKPSLGDSAGVFGAAMLPKSGIKKHHGFSLIELLVVVGIIVALAAIMAPAINFIKGSSDLGIAGNQVSGLLEHARTYAMSKNTYVWAGLMNVNPGGPLALVSVYSKDGTTNTNSTNLVPLGRLISLDNTCLASVALPNSGNLNRQTADNNLMPASNSTTSFSLSKGGVNYTFKNTIGFSSQGVAVTQGFDSIPQIIEIGLIVSRNTNAPPSSTPSNSVILQVSGITGAVKTFRP